MNVVNYIQRNQDLLNLYEQAIEKDPDCTPRLQKIYNDCISKKTSESLIFSEIYQCLNNVLKHKRIKVSEINPLESLPLDIIIKIFSFIPETLGNLRTTCKFVKNTVDSSSLLTTQLWLEQTIAYCLKHTIGLKEIGIALLEKGKLAETEKWIEQMPLRMDELREDDQQNLKLDIVNLTFELSLRYLDTNIDPALAEKNGQKAYELRSKALQLDDECFSHSVFNSAYLKFCVKFNLLSTFEAYLNELEFKEDIDDALIELIPALVFRWKDAQFEGFKSFVKSLPRFSQLEEDETDFSLFYAKLGALLLENGFEHDALELKSKINEEDRAPFRLLDLRNFLFKEKNILEAESILNQNTLADFKLCEAYLIFMEFYASIGKTTQVVSYFNSFKQKIYEISSGNFYQIWRFIFRAIKIAYNVEPTISAQTVQNFFGRLNGSTLSSDKKKMIVDSVFSDLISNKYSPIIEQFSEIFEKHVVISQCWIHLKDKAFEKILPKLKQTSLSFHFVFLKRYLEHISNATSFNSLFDKLFDYLFSLKLENEDIETIKTNVEIFTSICAEILNFVIKEAKNPNPVQEKISLIRKKTTTIEEFAKKYDSNKLTGLLGVLHLFLNNIEKAKAFMKSTPVQDRVIALINQ